MLKVVLDTNIILAAISSSSPYRIIIDNLLNSEFKLIISSEILLEYEEKLSENFSVLTSDYFINALLLLTNVERVNPSFSSWIIEDRDDNKFLDAYYTGKANYLVTNDKDFELLRQIKRPTHNLLKIDEFISLLKK